MMATVAQMLDRYHAGQISLNQLADDFRGRTWPPPRQVSDAEAHGVADTPEPDPDSWEAVDADSRLTPDAYQTLAAARQNAG